MNAGDLEELKRVTHPEFELHPIRAPLTGDYHGHRGWERFFADNAETFEVFQIEFDDIRMLDDGRLFASGRVRVRGVASQVDQFVPTAGIGTIRDGLPASWFDYGDHRAALEAAGLTDG